MKKSKFNSLLSEKELLDNYTVCGQVGFEDGVSHGPVKVSLLYNYSPYDVYKTTKTDKNGNYSIDNVEKGTYFIELEYENFNEDDKDKYKRIRRKIKVK